MIKAIFFVQEGQNVLTVWLMEKKTALRQVATQDSTSFLISANRIFVNARMVQGRLTANFFSGAKRI